MGAGSALRELAAFVEACESGAGSVTGVCFAECVDPGTEDGVRADVELTLPAGRGEGGAVSLRSRIDADGRLTLALESGDAVVPTEGHAVAVEPTDVTVDGDGTVAVTLSATVPIDGDTAVQTDGKTAVPTGENTAVQTDGDTGPTARERPAEPDAAVAECGDDSPRSGPDADSRATEPASPERDRDVPPFRDRELLASIYESEDTFAAMADRLEMDVTAETVRRYMIDYDIHEPDSYDTGGTDAPGGSSADAPDERDASGGRDRASERDGAGERDASGGTGAPDGSDGATPDAGDGSAATDDASPVVLSDGIGLPDDVTVDTLIESVRRSNTIYEVTQDVDMGRHEALEMLQDLNLLDLVVGRLTTETDRHITREDVISRLREASAAQ